MDHDQGLVQPTESTSASETHILDVNFDCLHEIFSLQCFSMLDLCSIGESHDRFKEVVDDVFVKQHKSYSVDLDRTVDFKDTTRILSNFSPFISELSIHCRCRYEVNEKLKQILELATEYCSSSTLVSLQLSCLTISEAETMKLQPIFDKLQKISLSGCKIIYSGKTLFSNCPSLVELKLASVTFDDGDLVLENTFPKLDRFEFFYFTDLLINCNKSNDFFSRHPNLKSLELYPNYGISLLLPGITDNCKQLTELDIHIDKDDDEVKFEKALTRIASLEHLNKLKINCRRYGRNITHGRNITKLIQKLEDLKSLEILRLKYVLGDLEFVPALSKLTKLKELKLLWCRGLTNLNPLADLERLTELKIESYENLDFDLVRMMKRLINLKTLDFDVWSFRMDQKIYLQIVDAVRERASRFHDALQIVCHTTKDFSADSFGDCRKLVRIIEW